MSQKTIEVSAKTVKEAVAKGCQELGCDSADVELQVLEMGSPGLFGLFGKPARVKLTLKNTDRDDDFEMPVLSLNTSGKAQKKAPKAEAKPEKRPEKKSDRKPEKKPEKVREEIEEADAEPSEAAQDRPDDAPRKSSGRRRREKRAPRPQEAEAVRPVETVPAPAEPQAPFVATPEEELTEETRRARDFLAELTRRMNVPAEIEVCQAPEQLRMVLSGENMSILIGRRGETLDALQYLTSLNINRGREAYLRISLDTENYRARREEALRKLAVRMANRCKKSGRRVALEPMNPYERRILHSALQADPEVTTHSEGEDPNRRVIITLK